MAQTSRSNPAIGGAVPTQCNTVFLRLADVASGLPDYEEKILVSSMDSEEDATGYSQRTAYNTVFEELKKELAAALKSGSKRLLATYLQTLLAYPDGCTRGETVFDPRSGDVIVQVPPLSEEKLYPKEKALVDLVAAERLEGRRVLVYVTHTGTRDITGRMEDILTRHGFRVAVMKADAVAPERREAWVADRVKEGIDVMICHPRLVQTGLDLIDFPTLCWFETDYSVYVMRQASRRSWRIGQTRPVKVVFMAYRNTLQADALKLVAKKLQSSLAVEGELPEDGLAAYGDAGDELRWTFDASELGLFEKVGVEQYSQHGPNVMIALYIGIGQRFNGVRVHGRSVGPLWYGRFVRHKEVEHVSGYEARGSRVATYDLYYVLSVEPTRLAQEGLFTVVVIILPIAEVPGNPTVRPDRGLHSTSYHVLGIAQRPAGEGSSALLNVLLRVVANAHGEELEKLSPEVLVYGSFVVVLIVQPDDHNRVFGNLQQQGVESSQAKPPKHVDLNRERLSLLRLAEARGEDAVPEEGDLLLQRALGRDHAV